MGIFDDAFRRDAENKQREEQRKREKEEKAKIIEPYIAEFVDAAKKMNKPTRTFKAGMFKAKGWAISACSGWVILITTNGVCYFKSDHNFAPEKMSLSEASGFITNDVDRKNSSSSDYEEAVRKYFEDLLTSGDITCLYTGA